jgi:hypothetical protein
MILKFQFQTTVYFEIPNGHPSEIRTFIIEIPNSHPSEISNFYLDYSPSDLPHNFGNSQDSLMEADYKESSSITIKYDEHNCPKCAKYHIVALGNLDDHTWSKESTAAPVMSQLELRILMSLAVHNKRTLKNCIIKQAFVQSSLPEDEVYFFETSSRFSPLSSWNVSASYSFIIWFTSST